MFTQQVAREVDRQNDAQGQAADHHQQEDDVSLEGQVVDGILPAPLQDLVIAGQDTQWSLNEQQSQARPSGPCTDYFL